MMKPVYPNRQYVYGEDLINKTHLIHNLRLVRTHTPVVHVKRVYTQKLSCQENT